MTTTEKDAFTPASAAARMERIGCINVTIEGARVEGSKFNNYYRGKPQYRPIAVNTDIPESVFDLETEELKDKYERLHAALDVARDCEQADLDARFNAATAE